MRFDDRFLDEIKSRLRLSDVIGKTIKLRRQGREYVGLSPFNKERSPSFFVNDDKGFYHDFSSGKHGDLISFLQETERLSFVEAVERLAGEAGVPLPAPDPEAAAQDRKRQGLTEWLDMAAAWFEAELRRPAGSGAREYLSRRGLPENEWSRFRIGYAPAARTALKDYLVAKGALPRELAAAGVMITPEDGGEGYDRFRDRIVFPITDNRGRTISFGGRALDPKVRAKYLNGPDTELFDKGRVLYGLYEARRLLLAGGEEAALVVVEGYMDVIACQRTGAAAVAAMGTALTEGQMELLWRLHPEPTLCFDGDRAGMQAASRAIDRALPNLQPGRSFRFAVVTGGKDPDDILREQGAAALKEQLGVTTPFIDALFTRERDAAMIETPEHRAGLKQRLRAAAKSIADADLASAYRDALLGRFDALFEASRPTSFPFGQKSWGSQKQWNKKTGPIVAERPRAERQESAGSLSSLINVTAAALALRAVADPGVLDDHIEALQTRGFGDPALDALAKEVIRVRLETDHLDSVALRRHLRDAGFGLLLIDVERAAAHAGAPFAKDDVTLIATRSQWSRALQSLHDMAALDGEITRALGNLAGRDTMAVVEALKEKRDLLRRAVRTGSIWTGVAGS